DRHEKLRLAVHKKLREPGLPERAPRRLIPNSYVVPTMKPREALRWRVRQDLAQHLVPRR
ncbi:HYLS1 protein, partial [Pitta sordida]|nr:HYLS1 protein [Pitta sordida]